MSFIWEISIVEFNNKTRVSGIVLEGSPPANKKRKGLLSNVFGVIASYFRKPYSEKKLTLVSGSRKAELHTDKQGCFNVDLEYKVDENFRIFGEDHALPLNVLQTYPVFFKESDYPIHVISDIDDTLLVSQTTSAWQRIKTILFISPKNRKPVDFTRQILEFISTNKGRIFFVSKSESNLFGLLSSAIQKLKLPAGSLSLTSYLRYHQLFRPKKGKDFKERSIRKILDNVPDKKFILIGDDTQQDIIVYSRIADEYPKRIIKIFIRKTRNSLKGNRKNLLNKLMSSTVSTLYFTDTTDPGKEISFIINHQNI